MNAVYYRSFVINCNLLMLITDEMKMLRNF